MSANFLCKLVSEINTDEIIVSLHYINWTLNNMNLLIIKVIRDQFGVGIDKLLREIDILRVYVWKEHL